MVTEDPLPNRRKGICKVKGIVIVFDTLKTVEGARPSVDTMYPLAGSQKSHFPVETKKSGFFPFEDRVTYTGEGASPEGGHLIPENTNDPDELSVKENALEPKEDANILEERG